MAWSPMAWSAAARGNGDGRLSSVRTIALPPLVTTFRSSYTISAISFYELRKAMGTSKFMIPVPLFDLKSLGSFRRLRCRDFKSAALALDIIGKLARIRHRRAGYSFRGTSVVDLTFATVSFASRHSECQIQNHTRDDIC